MPGVNHTIAMHTQDKVLAIAQHNLGERNLILHIFLRQDGGTRSNVAHNRHYAESVRCFRRGALRAHLHGTWLHSVTTQQSACFQPPEMAVNRGGGFQPNGRLQSREPKGDSL